MMVWSGRMFGRVVGRLAVAGGLMVAGSIMERAQAQVEPNDPACQDAGFMADALEAIKLKMGNLLDATDVSRRIAASGMADATLENPEAAAKGDGFLGCNYDVVVGEDKIRMFAKRSTGVSGVTWLVVPAL